MSDRRSLEGKRIVVTRARAQAAGLCAQLEALGALPIEFPTIRIAPMEDLHLLDQAITSLERYDWTIFTSVNGVTVFWERMHAAGRTAMAFSSVAVAAIGPATAGALRARGIEPTFVPEEYIAEGIAEGLGDVSGQAILLPRAQIARKALPDLLISKGAQVDEIAVYRTLPGRPTREALEQLTRGFDAITFTSPSTVRNFVQLMGCRASAIVAGAVVACIGPVTARAAENRGLTVDVIAAEYTMDGLVAALIGVF